MRAIATAATQATSEWFESWFDSDHYHRLYANRDQGEASAFVERLIDHLKPVAGATMLDLGCGSGRHSRSLAAYGYRVTGIDLSAASLAKAREHAVPAVCFIEQDMRTPFGRSVFDYVFSLFTSVGYFEDYCDNATVVRNIARSLRPGGTLVLDYLNIRSAERNLVGNEVVARGEYCYRITRWTTDAAFFKRIVLEDPQAATPVDHVERVSKLTLADFQRLMNACGFSIESVFGSYSLEPFDEQQSPRLIIIAKKTTALVDRSPAREMLANAAERFGRHPQIRREHRLGDAQDDRRVGPLEFKVPFFGRGAERTDDALVLGGVVLLQPGTEGGAVSGHRVDDVLVPGTVDQKDFGALNRLEEISRRDAIGEALRVGQPPRLGSELDDVFLPLLVDDELPQTSTGDERRVPGDVAGALQEVTGIEMTLHESGANDVEVAVGEGRALLEVRAQDRKC